MPHSILIDSEKVPLMGVGTERLLNEERKRIIKNDEKAMTTLPRKFNKRGPCFNRGKQEHFKRDCTEALI